MNDPIVRSNSPVDDPEVVRFAPENGLAPVNQLAAIEDLSLRIISNTLRNAEDLDLRSLVQSPLYRSQRADRVRKICAERDVPGSHD
jgi:hypothetical protein